MNKILTICAIAATFGVGACEKIKIDYHYKSETKPKVEAPATTTETAPETTVVAPATDPVETPPEATE
jgi:hypothetical protein